MIDTDVKITINLNQLVEARAKLLTQYGDYSEKIVRGEYLDGDDISKIASKLRDMKAEHKFLNLKGRGVNVWSISEFEYGAENLELEPTNFEGSDI